MARRKRTAPDWFTRAVETPCAEARVEVAGCPIHYLEWGARGKPGLVLVHGGGAHARWWSFVAPFLMGEHHVAALDLSGMGDSGVREDYTPERYVEEILAVAADAGMAAKPVIVGHSFGGFMAVVAGASRAEALGGIVVVDAPIGPPRPRRKDKSRRPTPRPRRLYADLATAVSRFRLRPPQPCENGYILDYIARHSLKESADGWTWKFDAFPNRRAFNHDFWSGMGERLEAVGCRVALMNGESSVLVTPEIAEYMSGLLGHAVPVVVIPEAHHHVMLDQPLAFVAALRAVLAEWEHSEPGRRAANRAL